MNINERYKQYREAERVILEGGQSYTIGSRTMTRAHLSTIRAEIARLESLGATLDEESGTVKRAKHVIFHD